MQAFFWLAHDSDQQLGAVGIFIEYKYVLKIKKECHELLDVFMYSRSGVIQLPKGWYKMFSLDRISGFFIM